MDSGSPNSPTPGTSSKSTVSGRTSSARTAAIRRWSRDHSEDYDAIYFTGGQAVMHGFPESERLQRITREIWERGGVVSSVCHDYCGLLNTRLTDGRLVTGQNPTSAKRTAEQVVAALNAR